MDNDGEQHPGIVAICVPWRPARTRIGGMLKTFVRWEQLYGRVVIHADSNPQHPFNRSQARNNAAQRAEGAEVLVFADACIYPNDEAIKEGVQRALEDRVLVHCFDHISYLGQEEELLKTRGGLAGGVVAVPFSLFEEVGGYDERFTGWGAEDNAFARACARAGGRTRVKGKVSHLWHESQARALPRDQAKLLEGW